MPVYLQMLTKLGFAKATGFRAFSSYLFRHSTENTDGSIRFTNQLVITFCAGSTTLLLDIEDVTSSFVKI